MRIDSLTEQLHDHTHEGKCGCGGHHSHVRVELARTVIGLAFIINAFLLRGFGVGDSTVTGFSALVGAIILGGPILWVAFKDLRTGALNTNVLVALAVLALFGLGHYEEAGLVSFFMVLGQIIEMRTAEGALASIQSLVRLTPARARRLGENSEEMVPAHELSPGNVIRVRPGENVAADGVILKGEGSFNQANITGEALPIDKGPGDEVFAGTVNLTGVVDVRVARAGADTTLGRVRQLILAAEKTKLPVARIIDQYMVYYTPIVLMVGGLVWSFTRDLERVVSVFIVSCPCAFVLATPTAIVAALSTAARLGILVKNVADLELASRITAFVFDKTGTLTSGKLDVNRLAPLPGATPGHLLQMAASAEANSNHPAAKALVQLAAEVGLPLQEVQQFREVPGQGVAARVNGARILVGRASWLTRSGVLEGFADSVDLSEAEGWSLIFVSQDDRCIGWVGLRDQIRPEARESLAELKLAGVRRLAMVTGDRRPVATRVAREIGCEEVSADCLPQDKVDFVSSLRQRGYKVAFVGDGVNDAPALAVGDLGIAMGVAGNDVAIHSAGVALMSNDLGRVPFLFRLSRETRRIINQNFLMGLAFVLGGMTLSVLDYINPVAAAVLHVAGSLLVVFNSFRLVRQGEEEEPYASPPAPLDHQPASGVELEHAHV